MTLIDRAAMARALTRALTRAPESKRAPLAVGEVSATGVFEGYASLFDVADLGGDVVQAGAFRDSLRKRGADRVKMLWQHDPAEPIGAWLAIEEDARGLKVKGRLNLEVARAREILALMREGQVDGLSIGFRTLRATQDRKTGLRHLQKLDLWEISLVTFPMLPQARVTAVKRAADELSRQSLITSSARARSATAAAQMEMKFQRVASLLEHRFDPEQLREEFGRWTSGGHSLASEVVAARDGPTEADCRLVEELCIVEATDTLPTSDFGASFFKDLSSCLERVGCLGLV